MGKITGCTLSTFPRDRDNALIATHEYGHRPEQLLTELKHPAHPLIGCAMLATALMHRYSPLSHSENIVFRNKGQIPLPLAQHQCDQRVVQQIAITVFDGFVSRSRRIHRDATLRILHQQEMF